MSFEKEKGLFLDFRIARSDLAQYMDVTKPFNIASYSLLTLMIARVTGLAPGTPVHSRPHLSLISASARAYIVMKYVEGVTLAALLMRRGT